MKKGVLLVPEKFKMHEIQNTINITQYILAI